MAAECREETRKARALWLAVFGWPVRRDAVRGVARAVPRVLPPGWDRGEHNNTFPNLYGVAVRSIHPLRIEVIGIFGSTHRRRRRRAHAHPARVARPHRRDA